MTNAEIEKSGVMAQGKLDCPVRDILKQTEKLIELLHLILEHCERCSSFKEGGKDVYGGD